VSGLALFGGKPAVTIANSERWPNIGHDEIETVVDLLRSGDLSISGGRGIIGEFEEKVRSAFDVPYVLAQNNGTSTLHAGYFGVGVSPGDEVIVPAYTWLASVTPILALNAIPVFCEVDPHTLTVDPGDVERRMTSQTRVIGVVHLWGNPVDMDPILAIAQRHGLKVVEDCSHAHGATYKGRAVGTIGDVGCFSMQASKVVPAGEGGFIVTRDTGVFDRIVALGHQGRIENTLVGDEFHDMYTGFGFKYRPHPLAIAVASGQFDHLDDVNERRRSNFMRLSSGLSEAPEIEVTRTVAGAVRGGLYGTRLVYHPEAAGGISRERYMEALRAEGVEVDRERYGLLHTLRLFRERINFYGNGYPFDSPSVRRRVTYAAGDLPVTEALFDQLIALPTFTDPPPGLIDQYVEAFAKVNKELERLRS